MILIYLSTAIGVTRGGSGPVQIYTKTIHKTTQITTEQHKELIWKSAGRAPSLLVLPLVFALQLRKKHGKTSVRVAGESQLAHENRMYRTEIYRTFPFVITKT